MNNKRKWKWVRDGLSAGLERVRKWIRDESVQFVYDLAVWGLWVYTADASLRTAFTWSRELHGNKTRGVVVVVGGKQTWPGLQMGQRTHIFPHSTSPHLLPLSSHCVSADTPAEGLSAAQQSQRCWPRIYAFHKSIEPRSATQIKFFAFHSYALRMDLKRYVNLETLPRLGASPLAHAWSWANVLI